MSTTEVRSQDAIRARVPLDVLLDTIQPFPALSEIYLSSLETLHSQFEAVRAVRV